MKEKKPFYKKWWFWVIIVLFVLGCIGNIIDPKDPEEKKEDTAAIESSVEELKEESKVDPKEEQSQENDEASNHPMPEDLSIILQKTVNNDVTGNWRLARVATSQFITDYAIPYYYNYFESDDEIHIVVNFTTKTTNVVRKVANILDVTVHEYVDKEEHSAKTMGSGMIYGEYYIHLDTGEVEEFDLSEE